MELKAKLKNLRSEHDLALFKWTAGKSRIAGEFILLSNLRLNSLVCDGGRVIFSTAAPVLYMSRGRPMIKFIDHDVMTITGGERSGINVLSGHLRKSELAVPAVFCESRELVNDNVPSWMSRKVVHMGSAPVYPIGNVIMPDLFRITRSPETLKPLYNRAMLSLIGAVPEDTPSDLAEKFLANIDMFGAQTDQGFVIANEYIASGGACVATTRGLERAAGSVVHMMPLSLYRKKLLERHWEINTGETNELQTTADGPDEH